MTTSMMSATRDIQRSVPFDLVRAAEDNGDGLTLEGYAAVWGSPTRIDSWEGMFTEQIRKGAFRKSIRERTPVMQFDHGHHALIGSIPIGTIRELREDDRGLFVSGRLSNNWLIEPVRQAIAEGAIDGMSFRFQVVRDEWRDRSGKVVRSDELPRLLWDAGDRGPLERTLVEVKVAELGPVVFPAYEATAVGVRAKTVADQISQDGELLREVRRTLAHSVPDLELDELDDEETRREVARAILYGTETSDDPESSVELSDDAPLDSEHPSEGNDAPPRDGHPSPESTESERRRAQLHEYLALMGERLTPIVKE